MSIESVTVKLLGKLTLECPDIPQSKIRLLIEETLNEYEIKEKTKALVVSDLPERATMFLAIKTLDGLSKKSIYNYALQLKKFDEFIHKPVNMISVTDIRIYLGNLTNRIKISSVNTVISILKSFFGWLKDEDYIEKNPMKKIKNIKEEKRIKETLTLEELEKLKDTCNTLRQRAMVEFFYSTGCRLDEVVKVNRTDINFNTMSLTVMGKGSKERVVYISPKCKIHLEKYLNSRTDDCEALFVTYRKTIRRLGRRSFQRDFAKLGKLAGIKKNVHPHLLRSCLATTILNSGCDITVIQKILGHESVATTQIYAHLSQNNIQQSHMKYVA